MYCQFCKKDCNFILSVLGKDPYTVNSLQIIHWNAHARELLTEIECRINARQPIHDTGLAKDIVEFVKGA